MNFLSKLSFGFLGVIFFAAVCAPWITSHSYETQNLPNDNLKAEEILKFRDEAWMKYHTHEPYLKLLEDKFGIEARKNVEDMTKIKLKRKLLGD